MTDFKFDVPLHKKSIIKVIGVGGGGSNAVNYMYRQSIEDVDFVVCNTDYQALETSPVKEKLQIGTGLTEGLGAGARPEVGCNAAKESREEIRKLLSKETKMLFITAGMGGGTGTGAAPVIAEIAKDLGILTVGIVTMPFDFEGKKKKRHAVEGIAELKKHCDTVLVILNERLKEVYSDLVIDDAFAKADDVLTNAAKSIAQIITQKAKINVDFQDVRTIMQNSGQTVMGTAVASGSSRARIAIEDALNSPLLNNRDLAGAQRILLSITFHEDAKLKIDELTEITNYIDQCVGEESEEMIWGEGIDATLAPGEIRVTIIATGFPEETEEERKVVSLNASHGEPILKSQIIINKENSFESQPRRVPIFNSDDKSNSNKTEEREIIRVKLSDDNFDNTKMNNDVLGNEIANKKSEENITFESAQNNKSHELKIKEIQERIKRMSEMSRMNNSAEDKYSSYLNVPAYLRRNTEIKNTPSSSSSNLSRFSLNDDDEIVGGNKFFDDNVD